MGRKQFTGHLVENFYSLSSIRASHNMFYEIRIRLRKELSSSGEELFWIVAKSGLEKQKYHSPKEQR